MKRLASLDLLRGAVMLLMVIDHARDYQNGPGVVADPMDLATTPAGVFWMRWITHFCAPVFAFSMGAAVFLARQPAGRVMRRGLMLLALEATVINWAWTFNPLWPRYFFQVIGALGFALVTMAAAVRLPHAAVTAGALVVLAGHNAFDGVRFAEGTAAHYLWSFLHQKNVLPLGGGFEVRTTYPVLPITAVAWLGYAMGPWLAERRRRALAGTGIAMLAAFAILRVGTGYGDMARFTPEDWRSLFNVTKYPLSLQFVLLTLGPALCFLAWAGDRKFPRLAFVERLGRVPLFFYVAHLYALHAAALGAAWLAGYPPEAFDFQRRFGGIPAGFGFPLWLTPVFAAAIIAALYPACRWWEQRHRALR